MCESIIRLERASRGAHFNPFGALYAIELGHLAHDLMEQSRGASLYRLESLPTKSWWMTPGIRISADGLGNPR